MEHSMDVPRPHGQRPARLPQQRPQPQQQPQAPLQQSPQSSSGRSSGSMHRRQHSPYVYPFLLHPPPPHPPFFSYQYHYPYPIYPYPPIYPGAPPPPPPPPQPLQPLSANRPMSQQFQQRPGEAQRYREQESQSPGIRLNDILKATSQSPPALVWLISHRPSYAQARRAEAHYASAESLGPSVLSQPATDPPINHMVIVSNEFMWEIKIDVRPPDIITIETVLFGIFATMHHGLTPHEWEAIEEPNIRRNAHWARCARLAKGDSHLAFNEEYSAIKRVDILGDKVAFRGLVPLSSSKGRCFEFLIHLGSTQSNDKKTRMRRGSF